MHVEGSMPGRLGQHCAGCTPEHRRPAKQPAEVTSLQSLSCTAYTAAQHLSACSLSASDSKERHHDSMSTAGEKQCSERQSAGMDLS